MHFKYHSFWIYKYQNKIYFSRCVMCKLFYRVFPIWLHWYVFKQQTKEQLGSNSTPYSSKWILCVCRIILKNNYHYAWGTVLHYYPLPQHSKLHVFNVNLDKDFILCCILLHSTHDLIAVWPCYEMWSSINVNFGWKISRY